MSLYVSPTKEWNKILHLDFPDEKQKNKQFGKIKISLQKIFILQELKNFDGKFPASSAAKSTHCFWDWDEATKVT